MISEYFMKYKDNDEQYRHSLIDITIIVETHLIDITSVYDKKGGGGSKQPQHQIRNL